MLARELGGSAPADGAPPRGLRNQLWNEYTQSITSYDSFIQKSVQRMTPTEEFNALNVLANMVEQQAAADAMLAGTAQALTDLADTHTKLKESLDNPKGDIHGSLIRLLADVKNANDFYASLQAKP
jgi:hypothetical protein